MTEVETMNENTKEILVLDDLCMNFHTDRGVLPAVSHVSIKLNKGQVLGFVGESGCGKSMTALSIMRLLPEPPASIDGGRIMFDGRDLADCSEKEMRQIRGKDIAMIFQEPMTSLNPVVTVGKQIMEAIRVHEQVSKAEAEKRAIEMIEKVGIPMPEKVFRSCPHQLSGGMRQRIMIAMALVCEPSLLICDEPTTALDVTIQAQILQLILDLKREMDTSVLLITHDMGVISEVAEMVVVMYAGQVVEYADTKTLFSDPLHPYTAGLMAAIPKLEEDVETLNVIPGSVPMLYNLPEGCLFAPRCPYAKAVCKKKRPEIYTVGNGEHQVRCFRYSPEWESEE
jgi:peptide/nickel transport system ATP-binding protein/oligopeptide transport system ATP-binding protein